MPSSLQRVPLQPPILGVQADRPQRFVDTQGLYDAQNMMFIDGLFRSRAGFGEPFVTPEKGNPNTGGPVVSFLQYNYQNIAAGNSEDRRFLAHTTGEDTANARVGSGLDDLIFTGEYAGPKSTVEIAITAEAFPDTCTATVTREEDDQPFTNVTFTETAIPTAGAHPTGICLGTEFYGGSEYQALWITEPGVGKMGFFSTRPGALYTEFTATAPGNMLRAGNGVVIGSDGNVWYPCGATQIGRMTTGAGGVPPGTQTLFTTPTVPSYPLSLCLGSDGNVWFTEYRNDAPDVVEQIGKITPDGSITEYPVPRADSYLRGIAAGPDGAIWFCEYAAHKIGRITTAGVITEFRCPSPMAGPYNITAGPDGNMWYVDPFLGKIGRVTLAGVITEFNMPTETGDAYYITAGLDGNVWYTAGQGRVAKVTPSGIITEYTIPTATGVPRGIVAGHTLDGSAPHMWFVENEGNKLCQISSTTISTEYSGACPTTNTPIGDTGLYFSFGHDTGHTNGDSWSWTESGNSWRRLDKQTNSWIDLVKSPPIKTAGFGGDLYGGCATGDHVHIQVEIDTPTLGPVLGRVAGSGTPAFGQFVVATQTIEFPVAHGFGTVGMDVALRYTQTGGTAGPTGLSSGSSYEFTVTSATVLTLQPTSGAFSTAGTADFLGKLESTTDTFKWSADDGATWPEMHVPLTTAFRKLVDPATAIDTGILVKFDSATLWSHAVGEYVRQSFATPLTGDRTSPTIFRTFVSGTPPNAYVLGTNGVDAPKVWDGTALVYRNILSKAGTDAPPPAKCMVVSANRLILGGLPTGSGLNLGPSGIIISDDMDFDSQSTGWGGTSGTLVQLLDTPGDIVAMQEFGNLYFVIYKEDSIYLAMAQAATAPFRFELKKSGIAGPCSSRSVVPLPNGSHAYLAKDGSIFVFDGNSVEPIGGINEWRKVQSLVLRTLDTLHPEYAWGMFDNEQQMLYFYWKHKGDGIAVKAGVAIDIPTFSAWPIRTTNIDVAYGSRVYLTFDTTIGELTDDILSYTNKIGDWSTERPGLIFGGGDGKCYAQSGATDNGTAIDAFWETGLNDFGDAITSKMAVETQHLFLTPQKGVEATNVSVQIGYSDYGEERNLTDVQVVDATSRAELPGYGPRSLGHRVLSRMLAVRFSASCSRVLAWLGSTLSYVARGQR